MVSWRNMFLIVLLALQAFGGSFNCKGSTHDEDHKNDDDTDNPPAAQVIPAHQALT